MDVCTKRIVHNKLPLGRKFGCPKLKYTECNRRGIPGPGIVVPEACTSRKKLSKLPPKCTFINNHKSYLKMRGYDVSTVYSVNRHSTERGNALTSRFGNQRKAKDQVPICVTSAHAPNNKVPCDKERNAKQNDAYDQLLKSLNKELTINGQKKADNTTNRRLGNVLTKSQLQNLLTQESPRIPKIFYT